MLSLKDVGHTSAAAGKGALKGVNLEVTTGEIYGIITKGGQDKDNLFRVLALLERPTTGLVAIDNKEMKILSSNSARESRKRISVISQQFGLLKSKTVYGNIALPLELAGLKPIDILATVEPALELLEIIKFASSYPSELSFEEQQKVLIARAIVTDPSIILVDDITKGLDLRAKQNVLQLLQSINENYKTTIVTITRDIELVKSLCHKVGILHKGEFFHEGSVYDLFTNPKSDIGKEYVRVLTRLEMPLALRRGLVKTSNDEFKRPVVRFAFTDDDAKEPLFSYLIQACGLKVNIIQAHQEYIRKKLLGIMLVELLGDNESIAAGIAFLQNKAVNLEVLGYASDDIYGS